MIVRDRPNAFLLFFVLRGSIVVRIWPQVLTVGAISALIVLAHRFAPHLVPGVNPAPFALLGIAISIFLSFRNTASYDRWWEARKLWGETIQTARDIARQTIVLEGQAASERREILYLVIEFGHRLVTHLRPGPGVIGPASHAAPRHPDAILTEIAARIGHLLRRGDLGATEALVLNEAVGRLSHAMVACERLKNTPLPFAYTLLLHRSAYLFCFMLPFGLADGLGWGTPLATMLVAYTFFGLDALAEELEEPFGMMPNDLPIAAYATVIEIALRRALGETDLPPVPVPVNYLLT